jgi:LPS-assembly protein
LRYSKPSPSQPAVATQRFDPPRDPHKPARRSLRAFVLGGLLVVAPAWAQDLERREEEPPPPWQEAPAREQPVEPTPAAQEGEPGQEGLAPRLDRISFEVPFPPEKGGGVAVGTAGRLEYVREDYVVASGGVELRFRDFMFQGERVAVDIKTEQITAEGDVILDQGPRRMVGDTLFFDLGTESGTLTNAKAYVDPDIFFEGKEITRLSADRYRVVDGLLTSCIDRVPDWNFRLSRAEVELEGYARVKHARFRIKKAPLIYLPYILYPAKTERTSGFLFPNLGYNDTRGFLVGLAYFQTLGDSYDTTIYADYYGKDYLGFGNEWRYRPSETTQGFFEGYVVDDPTEEELRWKVFWAHTSDRLPLGLRGVIRYQDFSDFNFFRDFERDFNNATVRRLLSAAFLTGSWGQSSAILLVDQNQTFIRQDDIATTNQLPELEYRLRKTQLGDLPLYVELLSSVNNLSSERTERFDNQWQRADAFPRLTASLSTLPWLSFSVTGGGRATWYSESIDPETDELDGGALTRTFASASSNLVGPSFSRVFNKGIGPFSKFKHIIEPRWNYGYVGDFEDQDLIFSFDEVDLLRPFHLVSYNFVNRLLAKPEDEIEGGGAREIMSLEIAQAFSLDEDRPLQVGSVDLEPREETTRGPIDLRFRFNPSRKTSLEAKVSQNTLFNRLNDTSLSGAVGIGEHGVGLTWFQRFDPEIGEKTGNQIRFFTGIGLWPGRLRLDAQLNYDFQVQLLQSQRYILQYFSQCYGVRLEFREFKTLDRTDRDFRFALTLKNIGTFLDLSGGTSTGFNPRF